MSGEPIGPNAIVTCRDQRFKLEQLLALDLVEAFTSTASLIQPLRQMARAAMAEIQSLRKSDWRNASRVIAAVWEEKSLGMWRKGGSFGTSSASLDRLGAEPHLSVHRKN